MRETHRLRETYTLRERKNTLRDTHIERHTQRYTETGRLEAQTH